MYHPVGVWLPTVGDLHDDITYTGPRPLMVSRPIGNVLVLLTSKLIFFVLQNLHTIAWS